MRIAEKTPGMTKQEQVNHRSLAFPIAVSLGGPEAGNRKRRLKDQPPSSSGLSSSARLLKTAGSRVHGDWVAPFFPSMHRPNHCQGAPIEAGMGQIEGKSGSCYSYFDSYFGLPWLEIFKNLLFIGMVARSDRAGTAGGCSVDGPHAPAVDYPGYSGWPRARCGLAPTVPHVGLPQAESGSSRLRGSRPRPARNGAPSRAINP